VSITYEQVIICAVSGVGCDGKSDPRVVARDVIAALTSAGFRIMRGDEPPYDMAAQRARERALPHHTYGTPDV
jgi:hypothetical protein